MTLPQSKSEALFDRIRRDILALALEPDSALRLPALSERYGVGLTPLRECLNRLSGDQLVVTLHNKGFRVASLTTADLLDLERSRNAIEGAMLTHALARGDDAWEAGVVGAYHHLSRTPVPSVLQDTEELAHWTRRHLAFHRALVAGEKSSWVYRFATQIEDQLSRYQLFIQKALRDLAQTTPHVADEAETVFATAMALEPHQALFDAALARDENAARVAFDTHTRLSLDAFVALTNLMPSNSPFSQTFGARTEVMP